MVDEVHTMNDQIASRFKHSSRGGFTLIEILLVISIIAVLSSIGMVSYMSAVRRSRDTKRISDIEQIRTALEMHRTDRGFYPDEGGGSWAKASNLTSDLVTTNYMPAIPIDPKGDAFAPYKYIATEGSGTPTRYYGYCLTAFFETTELAGNTCGITLPTVGGNIFNYGRKNP